MSSRGTKMIEGDGVCALSMVGHSEQRTGQITSTKTIPLASPQTSFCPPISNDPLPQVSQHRPRDRVRRLRQQRLHHQPGGTRPLSQNSALSCAMFWCAFTCQSSKSEESVRSFRIVSLGSGFDGPGAGRREFCRRRRASALVRATRARCRRGGRGARGGAVCVS